MRRPLKAADVGLPGVGGKPPRRPRRASLERTTVQKPVMSALRGIGFVELESRTGPVVNGKRQAVNVMELALRTLRTNRGACGVVWRNNVGRTTGAGGTHMRFGVTGQADVLGIMRDGRLLSIECKRPGQKPNPMQAAWAEIVEYLGGVAMVVSEPMEIYAAREVLTGR